jgi:hypothetical protein
LFPFLFTSLKLRKSQKQLSKLNAQNQEFFLADLKQRIRLFPQTRPPAVEVIVQGCARRVLPPIKPRR